MILISLSLSCATKKLKDCRRDDQCKDNEVCYYPMPDLTEEGYCVKYE